MTLLGNADWAAIEALRARVTDSKSETVQAAAQRFAYDFAESFTSVVLARVFVVVPLSLLPAPERATLTAASKGEPRLSPRTRVLSLLGSYGQQARWCDRAQSEHHLAIPLLDRARVADAPMIANMLSQLDVDFAALDDGRPIASRMMLGGRNAMFFVADAQSAVDSQGRSVIASREFVVQHGIRSVFGMGGAYLDGTLVVSVFFTNELVARPAADRYASLIGNFKIATAARVDEGRIY